jgi:peptidoglycan/xylan/chitin deacetylase (PgdA/CDA1 family)
VWRGPRDRPALALTFDDGPSESTPQILDILAQYGAHSTFFQCGANVVRLPEIARAVMAAGHEVGNHSYSHPYLFLRSPRGIENELRRAQETIQEYSGAHPVWFRAPYGVRWFGLGAAQRRLQLAGVMWTAIGYDWSLRVDEVVVRMAASASNGAILCLHDGRELREKPDVRTTVETVRRLVPMLLDRGYKFETVSRLICPKN